MGGSYGGSLGLIAFATALARGIRSQAGADSLLLYAWLSLLAFASLGYVVGRLAEWVVDDSVRGRLVAELAAQDAQRQAA